MRDWPQRKPLKVRYKYGQHLAQAEWHKILLPPLSFKLGLMKIFVKAMDWISVQISEKFPRHNEAKIKRVFFFLSSDPQALQRRYIQQLLQDDEKKAREAFRLVSTKFLGNVRANYKELMVDMSLYHKLGCNMSLKINMFHPHSENFPENSGIFTDEHGEMFMRKM